MRARRAVLGLAVAGLFVVPLATDPVARAGPAPEPAAEPTAVPEPAAEPTASSESAAVPQATATAELPGGGHQVFPGRRIVALYGHPGTPSLGVLGEQGIAASVSRARRHARAYEELSGVPVVPAFELIATVAQRSPGADRNYSGEAPVAKLRPWVDAAGRTGMFVLLDLQPGRAELVEQARRYRELLLQPHVGLAVDPEWKLQPGQRPLEQIGHLGAAEINRASAWLAALTREAGLPQKVFVIHQFRLSMIRNEHLLRTDHRELALLIHMDGQGGAAQKLATWRAVRTAKPTGVPLGWKNFYDEDNPMFSPERTMARRPRPLMVSYQ